MKSPTGTTRNNSAALRSDPDPPPDLARYLAPGDLLLDDEQLCHCDHLDGDHEIGGGRCRRCHCSELAIAHETGSAA
jgi:hypothetical protein